MVMLAEKKLSLPVFSTLKSRVGFPLQVCRLENAAL
jgi:hypothetical protein